MNKDQAIARVILVDDSENDNFFHEIALKKAGFEGEIRVFENSSEALTYLLADQVSVPTAVFLDINMPGLNGFDVARALQAQLRPLQAVQVHMLTSSAWKEDVATARSIPLVGRYLIKPLTKHMAADLLNSAGSGSSTTDTGASTSNQHDLAAHPS